MFKKIFALTALLCALPMLANAYTLNTWVQTTGGNIVVNGGTPQTNANGSVFKSYAVSIPVTVNAASGFAIKSVTRNGVTVATSGTTYPTTMNPADGAMQSVIASFAPANLVTLSATAGAGGSVSPASFTNVRPGTQTPPLNFVFSPGTGNSLQSISGLPGSGVTLTNALTGATVTLPADPNVPVRASFTSVSGAATLVGTFLTFTPVVANAGPPQTVVVGTVPTVTLQSLSTGPITGNLWTQTAGPSVTLSGAGTATATFSTPTTLGTYRFNLAVTGANNVSNASATVFVTNDPAVAAWNQCGSCHYTNNVGQNPNLFSLWSTSAHNTTSPVMCYACHIGAATGGHPGTPPVTRLTVNATTWKALVDAGPAKAGEYFCLGTAVTGCHSPANIWNRDLSKSSHFQNQNNSLCTSCHYNNSTGNIDIHNPAKNFEQGCGQCHAAPAQFAASPHAPKPAFSGECRTCHTGDVTMPDGSTARASKHRPETWASTSRDVCYTCHSASPQAQEWNNSKHKSTTDYTNPYNLQTGVKCGDCHNPHTTVASSTGCLTCHGGNSGTPPVGIQKPPHYAIANVPGNWNDPAYKNFTSVAKRNAQYYTPNNPCSVCHDPHGDLTIVQKQWAENIHAQVGIAVWGGSETPGRSGTDFKVLGATNPNINYKNSLTPGSAPSQECVRCHTKTGFVNFATSDYVSIQAWGDPVLDKTKEVITCGACHTDAVGTVRILKSWTAYVGYSAAGTARSGTGEIPAKFGFALPVSDLGKSNTCVSCHSHGRNKAQVSGSLVKQLNSFASYSVARVSVTMTSGHGNAIAAVPFLTDNEYVYKFTGQNYQLGDHGKIGIVPSYPGTGGPCAGCHLGTDKASPKGGHTFEAWKNFSSSTAGQQWSALCYYCHMFNPDRINTAGLNTSKYGAFAAQSSVKRVLRKSLNLTATTNLAPSATNAIRFYTGVGNFTYANRANLQGANLNSIMPSNSWWLHGPLLAKQILFDSLDIALHGTITGSIADLSTSSAFNLTSKQITDTIGWFGGTTRPVPFN